LVLRKERISPSAVVQCEYQSQALENAGTRKPQIREHSRIREISQICERAMGKGLRETMLIDFQ
jgi:hypothetical protein